MKKRRRRRRSGFEAICFCLCSRLSLSSPLLRGHPPLHDASLLWPAWRGESVGPAFLSASSFHLAFLLLQTSLFIYLFPRFSLAFLYCSASFFAFLLLPPLPSFLSIFLFCQGLSLSSCLVSAARLRHLPTLFQRL